MRINGRKVYGFTFVIISLLAIFTVLAIFMREILQNHLQVIIGSMVMALALFFGDNSADKYITSKNFVKEKWESQDENT